MFKPEDQVIASESPGHGRFSTDLEKSGPNGAKTVRAESAAMEMKPRDAAERAEAQLDQNTAQFAMRRALAHNVAAVRALDRGLTAINWPRPRAMTDARYCGRRIQHKGP
jgi:hypothetical protein